ncbi:MAG: HEAT repeat domain-containing protein [Candidatus Bipolaricaulia bacterium]
MNRMALSWMLVALVALTGVVAAHADQDQDINKLIEALMDDDVFVLIAAAEALGRMGPAARDAVPALVEALGDPQSLMRRHAAEALRRIGPDAVPALIEALMDRDWRVSQAAAWALGEIGPDARDAVLALTEALQDELYFVREAAAEALEKIRGTLSTTYQVQEGDSLWEIAKQVYGDGTKWTVIAEANGIDVESPRSLRVGELLTIPELEEYE